MAGPEKTQHQVTDPVELKKIREAINRIDRSILDLLNQRASLSLEVGGLKSGSRQEVYRPFREKDVLKGLRAENKGPLPNDHLQAIYREILSSSRSLQQRQRVVYLGPEGTFSYFAGLQSLGRAADFQARPDLEAVFR
ncbi:MAG: chorismate mutase, partial [Desulfohalobiaceae bacterium]|nr:chorismate mutase [Desulfohalobiaceae bacterium]